MAAAKPETRRQEPAVAFGSALRALDSHAAARAELAVAGVAQQRIDGLYGHPFDVAFTNLVPLVRDVDLRYALENEARLDGAHERAADLLFDILEPNTAASEWYRLSPMLVTRRGTQVAEQQLDARLPPAQVGSVKLGLAYSVALWNAWWLTELRAEMDEKARRSADSITCWTARYLTPALAHKL